MNYQPNIANCSRGAVTLERNFRGQFLKPVWTREWKHQGRHSLGLSRSLRSVRTLPGFGIDDPYEIRLERSSLSSRTVAGGITLEEVCSTGQLSDRETFVRGVVEQLVLGLARLHDGLAESHGYICPDNVRISPEGRASLWGFPTARWDYSELPASQATAFKRSVMSPPSGTMRHLDADKVGVRSLGEPYRYRAPEQKLTPASDVYSLCMIALKLLRGRQISEELAGILRAGTSLQPLRRPTLAGLARALNPDTLLIKLDVIRGLARRQAGLTAYRQGEIDRADEYWQEALKHDSLSAVVWNNLAVARMSRGKFEEALSSLERARELCASHPIVSSNIACCQWNLDDLEAAEYWARQANYMNPGLSQPYLCLSLICQSRGLLESAASHAFQSVVLSPGSPAARTQLARVYDQMGASQNALAQWKKVSLLPQTPPFEANLIDELQEAPWGKIRFSYGNISLSLQRV